MIEDKAYLQVKSQGGRLVVTARKEHAAELLPLFQQRGLDCQSEGETAGGDERIVLGAGVDRAQADEVLEAYKTAKGS